MGCQRLVLWGLLLVVASGCRPTPCEDECEEEHDSCITDANSSDEASECGRLRDRCYAVCDGASGAGQFDYGGAGAGVPE